MRIVRLDHNAEIADDHQEAHIAHAAAESASRRINEIILGKRAITSNCDLRLARYDGISERFFLGLQMNYDLMEQRRVLEDKLKAIGLGRRDLSALAK
jgi:plasmid maintenance system antidote protein VapI